MNEPMRALPTWQVKASRTAALSELERRVGAALAMYSNVHRGTGQYSQVTTELYERAREIVLEHFGIDKATHVVVFASPHGATRLEAEFGAPLEHVVSSEQLGLPLGVCALCVRRSALSRGAPDQPGGGTARLVSPDTVIWSGAPDRFEAGTPPIINVIAMASALRLLQRFGRDSLHMDRTAPATVGEILHDDEFSGCKGKPLMQRLRSSIIGRGNPVPVVGGTMPYVNLDHAASTPCFSAVWDCARRAWRQPEVMRHAISGEVRGICAEFLGAPREDYGIVFTANTTEAINAVADSLRATVTDKVRPVVLNTWLEHNSNELPWRKIPGVTLKRLSVDAEGFVDLDELERRLHEYNTLQQHDSQRIVLLAVSGASNVLGTYNDLEAICRIAHRYGARVLVDAAQLVAHRRIEMARWGVDYLAFSGHKIYAPFGTGVLVARRELLRQDKDAWESLNASGEENVVGIAALGKAMQLLGRVGMDVIEAEERRWTARLLEGLATIPDIELFGVRDVDSPRMQQRGGIVAFSMKQVPHNRVAVELAARGAIGVRSGCHCAHLLVKRLLGIQCLRARAADLSLLLFPAFTQALLPGIVRVSFGLGNDERDVDHLLETLRTIHAAPRTRMDRLFAATHNANPFASDAYRVDAMTAVNENLLAEVYLADDEVRGVERRAVLAVVGA